MGRSNDKVVAEAVGVPVGRLYHDALGALLLDCSETLKGIGTEEIPDASALRQLQEQLEAFVTSDEVPADIHFSVFLIDNLVSDIFKNFFGDAVSSAESDGSRRELCNHLASFFPPTGKLCHE